MSMIGARANGWLIWFHRWAGVVLCLVFTAWFATGAVLHFVGFPSLSPAEQAAHGERIDLSRIKLPPSQTLGPEPAAVELQLISVAGRPVYLAQRGTHITMIAGDSGEALPRLSPTTARKVAESFGHAEAASVSGPMDYDQWIVHQHFDPYRPLYRVRLNDPESTDLYVSAVTGEVVQRTRKGERAWNWVGAIIHWVYFTPLRKDWSAWNQTVWWLSLIALLSSVAGVWLGFYSMARNRLAGRRGLSPYRGWMRWHHLVGLFASLIVVTWMLSGWLSMDHGRLFSRGEISPAVTEHLRGITTQDLTESITPATFRTLGPASRITFGALAGHSFVTAYGPDDRSPRVLSLDTHAVAPLLSKLLVVTAVRGVWPTAIRIAASDPYDRLYRLAESVSDDALGFEEGSARIYVNPHSGHLMALMDLSRRRYAWIYYALHTLQFPFLIDHSTVRSILVLLLLTLGLSMSLTGVVLGVSRVRRTWD